METQTQGMTPAYSNEWKRSCCFMENVKLVSFSSPGHYMARQSVKHLHTIHISMLGFSGIGLFRVFFSSQVLHV